MSLWAFRFILVYLCIMIVQPQNRFTFLYPFKLADLSFFMAVLFHVAACAQGGLSFIRPTKSTWATIGLVGLTLA